MRLKTIFEMHKERDLHLIKETHFTSSCGERSHIYCKHYFPINKLNKKCLHIVFQHGLIEYHHRHEDLIDALRKHFGAKLVISVMDLYGHGLSGGQRGYIKEFSNLTDDMHTFLKSLPEVINQEEHEVSYMMIAHSLGGLLTLKTLSQPEHNLPIKIEKIVLTNPCISPKLELPKKAIQLIENIPETLSKVRVPLIYDAYDLSRDEEKAIEFMHDHLISKAVTVKLAAEIKLATKDINSISYFFSIPTLFVLSGDDRVVDNDKSELFITGMDKKLVKVKRYPGARHDILNETCRKEVFQEIIKYIEERKN